jgi:hypothetical protein
LAEKKFDKDSRSQYDRESEINKDRESSQLNFRGGVLSAVKLSRVEIIKW